MRRTLQDVEDALPIGEKFIIDSHLLAKARDLRQKRIDVRCDLVRMQVMAVSRNAVPSDRAAVGIVPLPNRVEFFVRHRASLRVEMTHELRRISQACPCLRHVI